MYEYDVKEFLGYENDESIQFCVEWKNCKQMTVW